MTLSPVPDLKTRGQLALVALAVWGIACASLLAAHHSHLSHALGDPDDALRLSMVRDLAAGQGWFDQRLVRLQPPLGLFMHWSRLIDGGEAALLQLFGLVLPPDQAEMAMRVTWPLLWLAPAVSAVLLVARRLGGGRAVFLSAVSIALSVGMSGQFTPGRIDHHNVQIACCLMAFAAAVQAPSLAMAIACAAASALGLAIGLEALPFHAAIGVALGLAWVFGGLRGRVLAAYGAALAVAAVGLLAVQTPPSRWLIPSCDALSVNLAAGLAVAGLALAACARFGQGLRLYGRLALLGVSGLAAGAVYLGLDPICVHGPMAQVDPELRRVWLSHVREMTPWARMLASDPGSAFAFAAPVISGVASWIWLGRRPQMRVRFAWLLAGLLMAISVAMTLEAIRAAEYAVWLSAPLIGAAVADVGEGSLVSRMIPAAVLMIAINVLPPWLIGVKQEPNNAVALNGAKAAARPNGVDPCVDPSSFQPLNRLPAGLVLSEVDAGSYVLASTADSALQAPYHRMTWGLTQARAVLGAPPAQALARVRALNIAYVVNCSGHAKQADRTSLAPGALQHDLDSGQAPAWLQPVSAAGAPLQIYQVRAVAR